ncbi:hypothetical protein BU25DRAFT_326871, partial [Macroventuria anomochaeta]
ITPKWLTKILVGGNTLCFLIRAAGGGIIAGGGSKKSADLVKAMILTGLCLQMVIFAFFVVVTAIWHKRMNATGRGKREDEHFDWIRCLSMLYTVSGIITVRHLFRVIKYAADDGYLLANEWSICIFDAMLMVVVLAICCAW